MKTNKKYINLERLPHWSELVSKIEPNSFSLLNQSKANYILAWEEEQKCVISDLGALSQLQNFINNNSHEYLIGFVSYDVKNEIEPSLQSSNKDFSKLPEIGFVQYSNVLIVRDNSTIYFGKQTKSEIKSFFQNSKKLKTNAPSSANLKEQTNYQSYLSNFKLIQSKLQRGDIYEMNYCVNFEDEVHNFNTNQTFKKLNELAQAPFSAYIKTNDYVIMSASPERFIKYHNGKLTSQPIKGTAKRDKITAVDQDLKLSLEQNPKERAENIMIVDIVRNDLSKLAKKNTVVVDELCQTLTFKTVHQLVSTVSCQTKEDVSFSQIFKALFPMGSMTGAPKISAMIIAEEVETFKRGAYSGAIGLIHPNGNFDFNVVIRSIIFNPKTNALSASVGGAITIKSDAENEYQECLTKLEALKFALC